jgi:hypothetical protein
MTEHKFTNMWFENFKINFLQLCLGVRIVLRRIIQTHMYGRYELDSLRPTSGYEPNTLFLKTFKV